MSSSLNSGWVCVCVGGGSSLTRSWFESRWKLECLLLVQAVAEASSFDMSKGREDNQSQIQFNRTTYYASLLLVESPFLTSKMPFQVAESFHNVYL